MVLREPECSPEDVQQGEAGPRVGTALHLQHDRDLPQSRQPDAGYGLLKHRMFDTVLKDKQMLAWPGSRHLVMCMVLLDSQMPGTIP